MVQPPLEFSQYRSSTVMATGDKQQPISVKKLALRDLPNENRNVILKSPVNSPPLKDRETVADTINVSGFKRQQSSYPSSPARPQTLSTNAVNGHLVYVRRKLETDPGKMDSTISGSPFVNQSSNNSINEAKLQPQLGKDSGKMNANDSGSPVVDDKSKYNCMNESKLQPQLAHHVSASLPTSTDVPTTSLDALSGQSTPLRSSAKPVNELRVCASEPQSVPTGVDVQPETETLPEPRKPQEYWKERYARLQMFLTCCDNASKEEYIRRLRSLTSAGRSKHACELEKRAIQLTLEEAKELHKVRILNVLGKALHVRNASFNAQDHSPVSAAAGDEQGGS